MPTTTLSHSGAFELCEGGTCQDPAISADGRKISCPQGDSCGRGCFCQLFSRRKDAAREAPWHVVPLDVNREAGHEPDKREYRCFCVRPILERSVLIDGDTYVARLQLCGTGSCSLGEVVEIGGIGPAPTTTKKIRCSGDCDGGCRCTMFRMRARGPAPYQPSEAKWEFVAKASKLVDREDGFYYRCFCVKGA